MQCDDMRRSSETHPAPLCLASRSWSRWLSSDLESQPECGYSGYSDGTEVDVLDESITFVNWVWGRTRSAFCFWRVLLS